MLFDFDALFELRNKDFSIFDRAVLQDSEATSVLLRLESRKLRSTAEKVSIGGF